MGDKINGEYFAPGTAAFNYNNVTAGADSASGGSGGSGMECLQLRSPPGPFHYLISEQAKSLVALQELQNEVGALLEFRDLVIETFPNLRSKMAPSTPASGARRDWEPGVRVRRKLAGGGGDSARAKPQPSVQDSGFSTETSCGKDAHSSSASATAARPRPLEDELWALLDVIQRKGGRLRDEAESLRGELDGRGGDAGETAEESFARALSAGCGECSCAEVRRLRAERDALLARAARLHAELAAQRAPAPQSAPASPHTPHSHSPSPLAPSTPASGGRPARTPLGRLDRALDTPSRPPRVASPDPKKFAAILQESNPVELQRQLLTFTVMNQVLLERLKREASLRTQLLEKLERAHESNEDLKFRLDEKTVELDSVRAAARQSEEMRKSRSAESLDRGASCRSRRSHSSMRDMEPLRMPGEGDEPRAADTHTPRRRPSRIPLHTATAAAHKGAAPRPPAPAPPRPPSAHSVRSTASARSRPSRDASVSPASATAAAGPQRKEPKSAVPVRRASAAPHDNKRIRQAHSEVRSGDWDAPSYQDSLAAEYVARAERLAPLYSRLARLRPRPLPADLDDRYHLAYESPLNLALELSQSIALYGDADASGGVTSPPRPRDAAPHTLWNGKPQQYFESMNYARTEAGDSDALEDYDDDSLAP